MVDLLSLVAQIGNKNASGKVMPWVLGNPRRANATAEELALAQAQLDDGFIFAS